MTTLFKDANNLQHAIDKLKQILPPIFAKYGVINLDNKTITAAVKSFDSSLQFNKNLIALIKYMRDWGFLSVADLITLDHPIKRRVFNELRQALHDPFFTHGIIKDAIEQLYNKGDTARRLFDKTSDYLLSISHVKRLTF